MHVDEAVHAIKFGELLEHNYYKYDPVEYHGPALNYLTLLPSCISGSKTLTDITESTLRIIPALCGIFMLAFFLFMKKSLGNRLLLIIILMISFSSLLIFYNRYYIQESLLAAFTFCLIISLYKYFISKKILWIILSGFFAGLMFASKETSIISFVCLTGSILFVRYSSNHSGLRTGTGIVPAIIFISVFISVSFLFFSSFFSNLIGPVDSLRAMVNYFTKAGQFPDHIQPWHYYFSLILFRKVGVIWFTEAFTLIFFVFGSISIIRKWNDAESENLFINIIFVFTLLLIIIYSIIPYKTPWSMMTFWTGCIIVSSYGIIRAIELSTERIKIIVLIISGIGLLHQAWQSYKTSFTYSYHPQNPFVYSHSTPDVKLISDLLIKITDGIPQKNNTSINITAANNDYWPLPWYLRSFKKVAWNENITHDIYLYPIILCSPELEAALIEKLYSVPPPGKVNLYIPLFDKYMELRSGMEIRGYIKKDLYDEYIRNQ